MVVGIVGAGLMGQGIAQVAAQAGLRALLLDARPGMAIGARERIVGRLGDLAARGRLAREAVAETAARLEAVASIADLAPCDVVIEAITEDLEAKRALFASLEPFARADAILATNTSSLSVTAIAAACRRPERVAGLHFFNPVPLMKVVEVVAATHTAPWVLERLCVLAGRLGHVPVRTQDSPGFIVNHAGRGYGTEALRVVAEGVAEPHQVDAILREAAGFRMGPFELLDLTGLDVSQPVMDAIYRQFYEEPRLRPTPLLAQRRAAGLLGRKAGAGFYRYEDGRRVEIAEPSPAAEPARRVWVGPGEPDARTRVAALVERLGARVDESPTPPGDALAVLIPWGTDATEAALAAGADARRSVALDAWFGLETRRTLMATPVTEAGWREAARSLFGADGVPVTLVRDSVGLVAPRVVAHIVNVACDLAQQRIAAPQDIERAVTLGLNYPKGPFALGDALGAGRVLALLEGMHSLYGDPRYRPSPWLRRRARLGVALATPEA